MKVLITGTARGIGRACALRYLEAGHEVIGFDIRESSISSDRYTHYIADITGELPEIEGVEVLVNNAGVQEGGNEIDVNLKGTIAVTEKYAITPAVHSVVFMASSSASNGAEFPLYAASKGGILAYMKNVALRIAQYGATCNSISFSDQYQQQYDRTGSAGRQRRTAQIQFHMVDGITAVQSTAQK